MDKLRERLVAQFDIARQEGMLHSKDGIHSRDSKGDAEDVIALIQESLPELAKEAGYVRLATDQNLSSVVGCPMIKNCGDIIREAGWKRVEHSRTGGKMSKIEEVKKHSQCSHKEVECPSREVDGTCLLINPYNCRLWNEPMIEEVKNPICPLLIYFEGDYCNKETCDYDPDVRGCCSGCQLPPKAVDRTALYYQDMIDGIIQGVKDGSQKRVERIIREIEEHPLVQTWGSKEKVLESCLWWQTLKKQEGVK